MSNRKRRLLRTLFLVLSGIVISLVVISIIMFKSSLSDDVTFNDLTNVSKIEVKTVPSNQILKITTDIKVIDATITFLRKYNGSWLRPSDHNYPSQDIVLTFYTNEYNVGDVYLGQNFLITQGDHILKVSEDEIKTLRTILGVS